MKKEVVYRDGTVFVRCPTCVGDGCSDCDGGVTAHSACHECEKPFAGEYKLSMGTNGLPTVICATCFVESTKHIMKGRVLILGADPVKVSTLFRFALLSAEVTPFTPPAGASGDVVNDYAVLLAQAGAAIWVIEDADGSTPEEIRRPVSTFLRYVQSYQTTRVRRMNWAGWFAWMMRYPQYIAQASSL